MYRREATRDERVNYCYECALDVSQNTFFETHLVISNSDTIIHPRAMVVHFYDTPFANTNGCVKVYYIR
jgi:hypothetical protein